MRAKLVKNFVRKSDPSHFRPQVLRLAKRVVKRAQSDPQYGRPRKERIEKFRRYVNKTRAAVGGSRAKQKATHVRRDSTMGCDFRLKRRTLRAGWACGSVLAWSHGTKQRRRLRHISRQLHAEGY